MRIMQKYLLLFGLSVLIMLSLPTQSVSQCPMCRMSAESNLENGGSEGRGLNTGILYMLAAPYLLVGTLGYIWWKNRRKAKEETGEV
jgi:hypothetical protein